MSELTVLFKNMICRVTFLYMRDRKKKIWYGKLDQICGIICSLQIFVLIHLRLIISVLTNDLLLSEYSTAMQSVSLQDYPSYLANLCESLPNALSANYPVSFGNDSNKWLVVLIVFGVWTNWLFMVCLVFNQFG